jgi:hypothetical protein
VPKAQNQPQPIRPNSGVIRTSRPQTITTIVIAPQNIECHRKPKARYRNMVGVRNRKNILTMKLTR